MFKSKSILVTGGTGSFGKAFVFNILNNYDFKKIIIFSRDELKQYEMEKTIPLKFKRKVRFFIGDVRDLNRLKFAMKDVDIVIHAAALKQVETSEYNPFEAVKTNVLGAQNVIESSLDNDIEKVLAISTDKASAPINLYGATKLVSDKLFISANNYKGNRKIIFSVTRYGNVMGSRGSVIPHFLDQEKKGCIEVTHNEMTRFNITLEDAIKFVINNLKNMKGGEIFIPKLFSYNIMDLKDAISKKCKVKFIGIRPGEKIHEELISENESLNTLEYKDHYIIFPNSPFNNLEFEKYKKIALKQGAKFTKNTFSYNSKDNKNFLDIKQLKKLISNLNL